MASFNNYFYVSHPYSAAAVRGSMQPGPADVTANLWRGDYSWNPDLGASLAS
ncbi:hypothetical protein JYU34_001229 [Plutella xylostella]|uniref:Uncharacterized protein n=1 Tax=Plutella xylostella TaxID=51655 RepID=A0ABQ7R6C7_PLUXY|nr:hypothetical protein JYU34_001229 [Plutella xylostella]